MEIPLAAKKMLETGKYNAVVCLGCVIRGGTPHFEYVASEVNRGISRLSLDSGIPVIQGIITADNIEQAIDRAGAKEGNRGFTAANSAIEMANLIKSFGA
jgi:6,7-dimethyl-8-ribityllumazine synthase